MIAVKSVDVYNDIVLMVKIAYTNRDVFVHLFKQRS